MKKIGVGLIGCGNVSARHFEAIKAVKELELVAVSDIVPERAKKAGTEQGVDWYSENEKIFERSDIDLVSICTPIATHPEIAMQAIQSGKDVLSEKPIGIDLREIDKLINESEKLGKRVFVVHQVRFNKAILALKNVIDSGKMGKIYSISLNTRWFRPREYFDKWYGKKDIAGGTLLNQGIHYIDIVQWL